MLSSLSQLTRCSFCQAQAEESVLYPFMEGKLGGEGHSFSEVGHCSDSTCLVQPAYFAVPVCSNLV